MSLTPTAAISHQGGGGKRKELLYCAGGSCKSVGFVILNAVKDLNLLKIQDASLCSE